MIYDFAQALIQSFPSLFSDNTEFTYTADDCSLTCLNTGHQPDVTIYLSDDTVCMDFVDNEDNFNWMEQYGAKEFRRLSDFVAATAPSYDFSDEEDFVTFFVE